MATDLSRHVLNQMAERLTLSEREIISRRLEDFCRSHPRDTYAVKLWKLEKMRERAWSEKSNGDLIIGIIRDGHAVTCMLRRSTQPFEPMAFRTRFAIDITEGVK